MTTIQPAQAYRYPAKRVAIARAALHLFARDGYERTSVDAIAAEADVSKRTVYNHYGDKEKLFLSVVEEMYGALMDQAADIADRELTSPAGASPGGTSQGGTSPDGASPAGISPGSPGAGGLEQRLIAFITGTVRAVAQSPERAALIRLLVTEAPHFPALLEIWEGRRSLTVLMARSLTDLPASAGLDIPDPVQAAGHLSALTFGQINNRSFFGLQQVSEEDLDSIITSGVALFIRAYRRI
jgi:TetR/AcrR family transcriptional regulator, mexJK operon transcriptional repressor